METALVHGTYQKMTALILFDPLGDTHTQQALLRWTGVYPTYLTCATYPVHVWQWHQDKAPAPRKLRYSNDPAVDGRIAADVNQLQRKPLPAPGEQSKKTREMLCQSYSEHPAAKAGCIDDAWLSDFCPGALGLATAARKMKRAERKWPC